MCTTKFLRELYDLTQKDISEKFDVPLATVKNWDSRSTMPEYVFTMMHRCLQNERQIKVLYDEIIRLNVLMSSK